MKKEGVRYGKPTRKIRMDGKSWRKGQIVIPKEARELFEIQPGDTVLLLGDIEQGIAIVRNDRFMQFAQAVLAAQTPQKEEP